jgi:Spy/CpxP family protein refolding chaperone
LPLKGISMSWLSPRRAAAAFLFACLLFVSAFAFAQGAKPATKAKTGSATAKSAHKKSAQTSKVSKHALTPEQQEKIAEEMKESKRAHDHPMEAEKFEIRKRLAKGEHYLPFQKLLKARDQMKNMPRYDSGFGRHLTAEEQASNVATTQAVIDASIPTNTANLLTSWQFLGPGNIGGRTRAIVIDPTNTQIMYAAAVAGGVWKTTNGGTSWFPLNDLMANLAVNSLVMDPNDHNTLYAGTGEGYFNLDAIRGAGIFKTIDGGANWTALANTVPVNNGFTRVQKIVVSKGNSQHVYAATRAGIFRSTDGGTNWTNISTGVVVNNGCMDLAIRKDVTAQDWLVLSCGQFAQATVYVNQDAAGAGTWSAKLSQPNMARTSIAIAPSNQLVVYAAASQEGVGNNYDDGLLGVFKSSDGGLTWSTQVTNANANIVNTVLFSNPAFFPGIACFGSQVSNQGWYDNVIAVDPADATKVFVGGIDLFRSDDSGANWGAVSYWWLDPSATRYTHADHHAIAFDPGYDGNTNQIMYVGDDGGIQKTATARAATVTSVTGLCSGNSGSVSWSNLNNSYGVTQFYDGTPFPNGTSYIAGAQDNGTSKGTDGSPNSWNEYDGGDGGYTAVDPTNTSILYSEYVNGDFHKSINGGGGQPASMNSGINDNGFLFIPPFILDPANHGILWTGGQFIWRTSNGMASWSQAASNVLVGTDNFGSPESFSAFAVDPTNDTIVYAGTSAGQVLRTTAGTTSTSATAWTASTVSSGNYVSWVAVDPALHTTVYATVSTYSNGSAISHVLRSVNSGSTWTAIDNSGNNATSIPDIPAHSVLVDPNNHNIVYVGTDLGIFVTQNATATPPTWSVENTNFANAPVFSLKTANNNLFAFTHGRSAWRVPLATSNPPDYSITTSGSPASVFPGGTTTLGGSVVPGVGYTGTVALSCNTGKPSTCNFTPSSADTSSGIVPFTATVGNATTGNFSFSYHGTDGTLSHDSGVVTVSVVDFTVGSLNTTSGTIDNGGSTNADFAVTTSSNYAQTFTLSCPDFPANGITCSFVGLGVSGNTLTLAPGGNSFIGVTFQSTAGVGGATANGTTVTVTSATPSVLAKSAGTYTLQLTGTDAHSDLAVGTITQSPLNPVAANSTVTYTVQLTNFGPDYSHNTKLTWVPPAGYTFVAAGSGPNCTGTTTVTCNFGALQPWTVGFQVSTNFTIKAIANAAGSTLNTFTASADEPDPNPGSNSGSISTVVPDFTNNLTNSPLTVFPGAPLNLTGTLTSLNGYASAVTLTCATSGTGIPSTCVKSPTGTVTPTLAGAAYNMSVTNTTAGDFNFNVHAVGADAAHATHNAAATVHVVNFTVGNVTPASGNVNKGASVNANFDVTSINGFAGNLTLSCGSLPVNTSCTFAGTGVSGNVLTIAANAIVTVTASITTTPTATAATTNIIFKAAATVPSALTKTSTAYALTINNVVANADLSITGGQTPANAVTSGNVTYNLTVASAGPNPATAVTVTSNTPAGYAFVSATPSTGTCNAVLPISCNLGTFNNGDSQTIAVVLTPAVSAGTNVTFTVASGTADNVAANNAKTFSTTTPDYTLAATNSPIVAFPSQTISLQGSATAANGYSSQVNLTCTAGIACSGNVTPTNTFSLSSTAAASTGNVPVTIQGVGTDPYTATHSVIFSVNVVDFTVGALAAASAGVNNGSSTSTTFTIASNNNFAGTLALSCPGLPANGVTCSFSGTGVAGNTLTLAAGASPTITVTFLTTTGTGGTSSTPTLVQVDASTPSARTKNAGTFTVNLTGSNANSDLSVGAVLQSPVNPVTSAQTVTYTFAVTNNGPDVSHNTLITYNVPAGYTFVAAGSGPSCAGTTTVVCDAGSIASGSSANFTIKVTPGLVAAQLMTFTASADEPDSNPANNSGSTTTNVKDFTVGLGTNAITIPQAPPSQSTFVTIPVTITGLNGFITSTALACVGQPTGVTCAFTPASVVPNGIGVSSTLKITATSTVAPNVYHLQIKGTAGTLIHTQPLAVTTGGPNFTQAVLPTTQNVNAGASTQYTVTYTALGGMTQDIAVGCVLPVTLQPNVTCTPVPAIVTPGTTPGNSSVVTLSTTFGATPAANATVAIAGTSAALNNLTRSTNVTLSVKDFTVTRNTASVSTNVGTNITDTILVKGVNGFTGNVALVCAIEGVPVGTACNLSNANPAASASGTSVTATISSTAATTPPGSYLVDVTGTTSGGSKPTQFTVVIKDFTLGLGTGAITIPQPPPSQSSSLTVPITLTAESGFNSSTALSCLGQPTGITCAFSPASAIPTAIGLHSTLTVTSTGAVLPNTYHLQVKAAAGTLIRTQALDVTDFGPNFTQAVTPAMQNVVAGSATQYTVTYTPLGGMTQDIAVGCTSTLPIGVHCSANPPIITPGTTGLSSVVTLSTDFGFALPVNTTVTISGVSAALNNLTRSNNVTLSVKDFTVTANSTNIATNVGTNITDTIVVKGVNGFTGNVALACLIVGTPVGTSCTLSNVNPAATSTGTSVIATIHSDAATTPTGDYTVQVTGTTVAGSHTAQFTVKIKGITLAINPTSLSIPSTGGNASTTVTTTALNGFTGAVTLSCATPLPTGITCGFGASNTASLSVTPTIAGTNTNLKVTATASAGAGLKNLTVKAVVGTLTLTKPLAATVTAASNAALSGTYTLLAYQQDTGSSQPMLGLDIPSTPFSGSVQQMNPTGFKSQYMTVTFDGSGHYSSTIQQNLDGVGSSPTQNGTYSVATDGSVSIDGGVVAGQVKADGSSFLVRQTPSHQPNIVVGIKNGGSAFTNASLSGTYTLLTYQHDTGSSQPTLGLDIPGTPFSGSVQQMNPTGFKSQYMTVVFDGAGNYSASIQENVDGVGSSTSQNGTYSVAADGSVSIDGGVVAGHLSADASTFIVRQTPSQQPNIVVGIKNGGSAFTNASLTGTYTLLTYQHDTGSAQPTIPVNVPSTPFSGSVQQMNPTGFKSQYMTVTFDGAGNYSSNIQQNVDGAGSSPTQNGTYSVATDGSVSIDSGVVAGQLSADATTFVVRQTPTQQPNIVVGIKN